MKIKIHIILYAMLGLAVLAAAAFGANASMQAASARRALEDVYTLRLSETREQLQAISDALAKAPAVKDARMHVEMLTAVSRRADSAAGGLCALPVSHAATSDTVKFCNQLSEYTLELALRIASGESLSAEVLSQLEQVSSHCTLLMGQLAAVQNDMGRHEPNDFYAQDDSLTASVYDGVFSDAPKQHTPRGLGAATVDARQAVDIARRFVGESRVRSAETGVSAGGTLAAHGVRLTLMDGTVLNAEVTQQGGQLLWMMPERAAFAGGLTLEECTSEAQAFLSSRGYPPMEAGAYQVYDGLAVIEFIPLQQDVLLYPDAIKLQLRMDTGEVVGMEARQYLMNHTERTHLSPALTQEQALKAASPLLKVNDARLCVVDDGKEERLCYELLAAYAQQQYRVCIDADTGEEVSVQVAA